MSEGGYQIRDQYSVYFMTFTTVGWIDFFTRKECKQIIIESLQYCIEKKGLVVYAFVLMESHLHLVVRARESSAGLSAIVRDFKKFTSKQLIKWITNGGKESRKEWMQVVMKYHAKFNNRNSIYQIWHQINQPKECLTPQFTWQKINYIHDNPIRAGIVDHPEEYRHSSARNYLNREDCLIPVELMELDNNIGFVRTI